MKLLTILFVPPKRKNFYYESSYRYSRTLFIITLCNIGIIVVNIIEIITTIL
jgi:hypothetical protein